MVKKKFLAFTAAVSELESGSIRNFAAGKGTNIAFFPVTDVS